MPTSFTCSSALDRHRLQRTRHARHGHPGQPRGDLLGHRPVRAHDHRGRPVRRRRHPAAAELRLRSAGDQLGAARRRSSSPASTPTSPGFTVLFTCQLDDAVPEPCTSPYTATVPPPDRRVAHASPSRAATGWATPTASPTTWEIDTAAPMFQSFIGPADPTPQTTATFAYTDRRTSHGDLHARRGEPSRAPRPGRRSPGLTASGGARTCSVPPRRTRPATPSTDRALLARLRRDRAGRRAGPADAAASSRATLTTLAGAPVAGQKVTFRRGTAGGGGVVPCSGAAADGSVLTAANGVGDLQHQLRRAPRGGRQRRLPGDLRHHAAVPRQPRQCRGAVNQPTGRAAGAAGDGRRRPQPVRVGPARGVAAGGTGTSPGTRCPARSSSRTSPASPRSPSASPAAERWGPRSSPTP